MCIVLTGALLVAGVTIGIAPRLWRAAEAHDQMPTTLPPFQPLAQSSYVFDSSDTIISVFERERSQPVKIAQVPDDVIAALLSVEDEQFYVHHGVNVRSFMRALLSNFSSDAPRQGASTITQQVVKNEFLAGLPRDARYKALQAHYAVMLEKQMTKGEILERYLNTVFFGNNAYGLQAAAEVYFGKSVEQLTMIEGAFLAGLVRSPSGFDPIRRPEQARVRFKQVLQRLVLTGLISQVQADGLGENYVVPDRVRTLPTLDTTPTYYTSALRDYLLQDAAFLGPDEQSRANLLYRGGLRIHTTFDPSLQASAQAAQQQMPPNAAGFTSAIVSLDTTSGAVRAMVGGTGYVPVQNEVNMALVPRQTGSSIKFFILAAALQAGVQPTDIIDGRRGCVLPTGDPKKPFVIDEGTAGGVAPLNQQTWLSVNCAFARLSQIVGLNRVVDTTYRMARSPYLSPDISPSRHPAIEPFPSFATGANEMSPLDMASGIQTLANQGLHHEPYYVDSVDLIDGTRYYTHQDAGTQVLDSGVALTALDIMKGVLTRGTARQALSSFGRPAAGKTGTQQDNSNAWFVGATPQLSTAVWVGDPNSYKPMMCGVLNGERVCNIPEFVKADGVSRVQGGTYPAKIWGAYMDGAPAALPVLDWPAPPPPARGAMKLYLPGVECLAQAVATPPSAAPATTVAANPAGLRLPAQAPGAPPSTAPATAPETTTGDVTSTSRAPVVTRPPVVYRKLPSGTTIAPNVLDPLAPVPTVALSTIVYTCNNGPSS